MSQSIFVFDENADFEDLFLKNELKAATENHEFQIFSTVNICLYVIIMF